MQKDRLQKDAESHVHYIKCITPLLCHTNREKEDKIRELLEKLLETLDTIGDEDCTPST